MDFNFNTKQISASLEVFPKDRYEVTVLSEPKPFFQAGKPNAQTGENYPDQMGLRYTLRIAEGEYKGKPVLLTFNFLSEFGDQERAKGFLLASYGYKKNRQDEDAFDEEYENSDFKVSADPDGKNSYVGEMWNNVKGKRLYANLDVAMSKDGSGRMFQQFKSFEPFGVE